MRPAEQQELEQLRREVADLRELVAAYEAAERGEDRSGLQAVRQENWVRHFRALAPGSPHSRIAVRLMIFMLDRAGRPLSRAAIVEGLAVTDYEADYNLAGMAVCALRKFLRLAGFDRAGVETVYRFGFLMTRRLAQSLRAFEAAQWGAANDAVQAA